MNLIGNWPSTVAMWFADSMKVTYCKNSLWNSYSCYNSNGTNACVQANGVCTEVVIDGFYVIAAVSLTFGVFWILWKGQTLRKLQLISPTNWSIK